ncbi:hypothetical protein NFI96_021128 [Prochilodus magdalenae]|nr:hypothetical protein NFI96_021128 [Prochilodus magdalenae]
MLKSLRYQFLAFVFLLLAFISQGLRFSCLGDQPTEGLVPALGGGDHSSANPLVLMEVPVRMTVACSLCFTAFSVYSLEAQCPYTSISPLTSRLLCFLSQVRRNKPSRLWYEGSVEDEEDDEDFHVVEAMDEQQDRPGLNGPCPAWDVSRSLGMEDADLSVVCELKISEESRLLSVRQLQQLSRHFPDMLSVCDWMLVYQTETHGSSLRTLYRTTEQLDHCMVLMIRDTFGQVFGAVCSAPLRMSSHFFGTGQTFLFSFSPHLQVYKWTGDNSYFIKGSVDSLQFGGGSGRSGLWLNGDLIRGRSQSCDTFDNDVLSSTEDFLIGELEVWALV